MFESQKLSISKDDFEESDAHQKSYSNQSSESKASVCDDISIQLTIFSFETETEK